MKLVEGIYENLINRELSEQIDIAQQEGLVCNKIEIDNAESPQMLSHYLADIIQKKFESDEYNGDENAEKRMDFINKIIALADSDTNDVLTNPKELLGSVMTKAKKVEQTITKMDDVRPLSGFRSSNLFTGGQSSLSLENEIQRDIASSDHICLIVSFLRLSGVRLIYDALKKFCSGKGHTLRVITTTYCGATEAKAVDQLSKLPNTTIKISYNTKIERLHAKSYIFIRNSGLSSAFIGSSNLSKSAQTNGLEWNIRVTNVENPHIIKTAMATFEMYWNSPNFEDFNIGGIEKFYNERNNERAISSGINSPFVFQPYSLFPHQKAILDKLKIERKINNNYKNLVVAATGTGKTVISGFDYKSFRNEHHLAHRLLFIAHREEILRQSLYTFRNILGDANFGEMMTGKEQPRNGIDYLFASVQTFNSKFDETFGELPHDYFDYIIIDEAHHSKAMSYRKLFSHFKPKILLGLTATPERMDGESLLPDFGGKISAEIRLPEALETGLLTPFQYLCITDPTDLTDSNLWSGGVNGKYITSELSNKLCDEQRVNLIVAKLNQYLADENAVHALCFCNDKKNAQYTAQELAKHGLKADYLTSDSNSDERKTKNKKLASGEINYLCVVDIFNEGVDIPEIDTVLFLRPTESITIFLQQLGRGLRLSPGKDMLTVLDFVAQMNNNYNFASRFRSLLKRTDTNLTKQIKDGFTLLPHGCSILMEEKAREEILNSIKSAIYNQKKLVNELRQYRTVPSLGCFVDDIGQDVRLIYKNNNCWTSLKRSADLCEYEDDNYTKLFAKGIANLVHNNSSSYLYFINELLENGGSYNASDEMERTFALMFYYAIFQNTLSKAGFLSLEDAFGTLLEYPLFVQEIKELIAYKLRNINFETFSTGEAMPKALEQYGCYTREEVFTIFGRQTEYRRMQGSVTGVFALKDIKTELLFVTLNKSDKEFSVTTQYNDYVISENKFHWQSQNTDTHSGSGARFVNQRTNGTKYLLFVREYKKDGFGNTCPFICFGLVDYVKSSGDRPMNIEWQLHHPVLPEYMKAL